MITAQQLMWARIASGVLALLIVNQGVGIWRARRKSKGGARRSAKGGAKDSTKPMTVFLIVFCAIELGLAPLAITGSNPTTSHGTPLFVFLLPLACFAVAIGGVITFVQTWRTATASRQWPSVAGVVATSDISIVRERDDHDEDRPAREIVKYQPDIRYTYQVDGIGHSSAKLDWGWDKLYGAKTDAQAAIAKYPVGSAVTVFYDPANPDTAVLRPRSRGGAFSSLVFAAIFGVGGAIFFWAFATFGMK